MGVVSGVASIAASGGDVPSLEVETKPWTVPYK